MKTQVIQYQGDWNTLAWKYPNQSLVSGTHIIVQESQKAILVANGQLCDVLNPGEHTLSEEDAPLLYRRFGKAHVSETVFAASIWYFNMAYSLNINWGTQTPIQLHDPRLGSVKVRSHGRFGVQLTDPTVFLTRLLGTMPTFKQQDVVAILQGNYIEKIKAGIASYAVCRQLAVQQLNAYLEDIAASVKEKLNAESTDYGLRVHSFFINDISIVHDETLSVPVPAPAPAQKELICADCGEKLPAGSLYCLHCGKKLRLCPQCGRDLPATVDACPDCGYVLPVKCPQCGVEISIPGGASFCPKCGARLK